MEDSGAKILAVRFVRSHCPMLLLDAKQAVEAHVREYRTSYAEAAVAVVTSHQRMLPVDAAPEMLKLLIAASYALRSYQYGNGAPDLAEGMANDIDDFVRKTKGNE